MLPFLNRKKRSGQLQSLAIAALSRKHQEMHMFEYKYSLVKHLLNKHKDDLKEEPKVHEELTTNVTYMEQFEPAFHWKKFLHYMDNEQGIVFQTEEEAMQTKKQEG